LDPAYDSITDKNVSTPQSIQTVNNIVGLATAKPSAVNPEIANQIIAQNVKGNITLTPEQLQSIKAANALNEVANDQTGIPDANTIVPEGQSNLDRVSSEMRLLVVSQIIKDHWNSMFKVLTKLSQPGIHRLLNLVLLISIVLLSICLIRLTP